VITSLNHTQPDYVPSQIDFTWQEYVRLAEYYGDPKFGEKINNHVAWAGCDNVRTEVPGKKEHYRDIYGVVWNCGGADKDIGAIEGVVIPEPSLKGFSLPPVNEKLLRDAYSQIEKTADKFIVGGIGFSLFERAWTLCGMENVLTYMITDKSFLHELLDLICERNLAVLDIILDYGIDCAYFGDDWGQQKGLIMGPDYWREFIKPRLKRMYGKAKAKGKFVAQHSCGDISAVLTDVIDAGLDVYQTFQPEIYDIAAVKKQYGGNLSFWGGISTQHVLAHGTPADVERETIETLRILGKGGGYIAAPTHAVPGDVPPENFDAMLKVFLGQKK